MTAAVAFSPVTAAQAGEASNPNHYCRKYKKSKKCSKRIKGRMTGHGHEFDHQGFDKVQWEFRNSVCNSDRSPTSRSSSTATSSS